MRQTALELIKEIDGLLSVTFKNLIGWEVLSEWIIDESRNISGTHNTKVFESKSHIRFFTILPPGSKFDSHVHNCTEVCTILSGWLTDGETGKEWGQDEKAVFAPGQKHKPMNNSLYNYCYIIVDFYK